MEYQRMRKPVKPPAGELRLRKGDCLMKLVVAIINRDDVNYVIKTLTQEGFSATKLSTTGGFLMSGNATVLVGVEDSQVSRVISSIKKMSHSRKIPMPQVMDSTEILYYNQQTPEIMVGGATIFVLDVEHFEKV